MAAEEFLILETFRDLTLTLTRTYLVRHLCSQCVFTSPLRSIWLSFGQNPSISPALGFIIQKLQNLIFDLTSTRVDLNLKILRMLWGVE